MLDFGEILRCFGSESKVAAISLNIYKALFIFFTQIILSSLPQLKFLLLLPNSKPWQRACIDTSRTGNTQDDDCRFYCIKNFLRPGYSVNRKIHTQIEDDVWIKMLEEAKSDVEQEPILSNYYYASITSHRSLDSALAHILSVKLSDLNLPSNTLFELFISVLEESPEIIESTKQDLIAVKERDPACISYVHCFLGFKGFLACQAHRIAHKLWKQNRKIVALLIQNRVSEAFAVDVHPGAKIGKGILLDHATGVVIGETAVVGDNVSIIHGVTLGGTHRAVIGIQRSVMEFSLELGLVYWEILQSVRVLRLDRGRWWLKMCRRVRRRLEIRRD